MEPLNAWHTDGAAAALSYFGLKLAAVPGAVKMYRRAAAGFEAARRSIKPGDPHGIAGAGFAHHGTEDLPGILSEKRMYGSPIGENGQYGSGVYWWKGFPYQPDAAMGKYYLNSPRDEGILSDLKTLPGKRVLKRNIYSGHMPVHQAVTGPEDYKLNSGTVPPGQGQGASLRERMSGRHPSAKIDSEDPMSTPQATDRPRDYAVMDTATRAQNKTLGPLLGDAAEAHVRPMDSDIYHIARKQVIGARGRAGLASPSKGELIDTLAQHRRGIM